VPPNHPKFVPGKEKQIQTSRIASATGRIITTVSGSVYELGTPDPKYLDFLKKIGREFDPVEPIKTTWK
jgi:hypothetical protein